MKVMSERNIRAHAKTLGFTVKKSRGSKSLWQQAGLYQLYETATGCSLIGHLFDATLQEIGEFIFAPEHNITEIYWPGQNCTINSKLNNIQKLLAMKSDLKSKIADQLEESSFSPENTTPNLKAAAWLARNWQV